MCLFARYNFSDLIGRGGWLEFTIDQAIKDESTFIKPAPKKSFFPNNVLLYAFDKSRFYYLKVRLTTQN